MKNHGWSTLFLTALATAIVVGLGGCGTRVKEVQVENRPVADRDGSASNLKGMSPETLAYFDAKYPRDSWQLPATPPVVAVGPTVFSKSAISLLEADASAKDSASTVGDSATLLADNGRATFVMSQKYSPAVQAIITESLARTNAFTVKAMDDAAGLDLYRGKLLYSNLYDQKVKFFVESNLTAEGGPDGPYQVFLRLIETRSGTVVCAVSQAAHDVRTAAGIATARLVSQFAANP